MDRPHRRPTRPASAGDAAAGTPAGTPFVEPAGKVALAWAAAAWERVWPAVWPMVALAGLFAALALLDVLPLLPGWLHLLLLAGLAAAGLAAGVLGLKDLRLPDRAAARRRLERDSGLPHRPLTGLRDEQAGGAGDPASGLLWRLHQERLRAAAARLRVRLPRPGVTERDRYGLRGLIALLLVIGGVGGWGEWGERFARSASPHFAGAAAPPPPALDLFITPPAYTGVPPIYLRPEPAPAEGVAAPIEPIAVPVNSTVLARVTGGGTAPVLRLGDRRTGFAAIDGRSFEVNTEIGGAEVGGGNRIAVEQNGVVLGAWPIRVVPDAPPTIAFARPPEATERSALRLEYEANDDYGIEGVTATFQLDPEAPPALDRTALTLDLTVPGHSPRHARAASYLDLTPHPWAGQTVTAQLSATDGAGQTGVSEPITLVLPERNFTHPVARAIIEQRRTLMLDPARYLEVSESLETLSLRPDRFYDDPVVFLALRTAARRLALSRDPAATVEPVQRLLWDTALRLEDGDLSLAERELRQAQQALMEALAGDASDAEIARRMDELRAALDRYLRALEQSLREQIARGEVPPMEPGPDAQVLSRDQLQDLLDRMQRMSETGARDAARQMLSQLQEMLENLRTGALSPQQRQQQSREMQLLEDLQNLMQAQQGLLDQTFRQAQQGRDRLDGQSGGQAGRPRPGERPGQAPGERHGQVPGQAPGPGGKPGQAPQGQAPGSAEGAATQQALRRALGELMREMDDLAGDIPTPMGRAEQAMRQSEQALGQGRPGQAVGPQTEALDALQQGMQTLVDRLMEQMAQQGGVQLGPARRPASGHRDPLGRPLPNAGTADVNDVVLPREAEMQRARQILDELRRRLGERGRPQLEREYLERLLRRF